MGVDTDSGSRRVGDAAQGVTPLDAVRVGVQLGVELAAPEDRREALARPGDICRRFRGAGPLDDVDPSVAVADERGVAIDQRLVGVAIDRRTVVGVDVSESPVERGEQPVALIDRHHHRSPVDGARRLVAAWVVGEVGAGVVDPQDVGDGGGILRARSVGRHEHRRPTVDRRPRTAPDAFTRQRLREHRLDRRWRVAGVLALDRRLHRAQADAGEAPKAGAAPAGGTRRVVLGGVDDPVTEGHVRANPFCGALGECLAGRPEHVAHVGDPEVDDHEHQRSQRPEEDPPPAEPPPRIGGWRAELETVTRRLCGSLQIPWWPALRLVSVFDRHGEKLQSASRSRLIATTAAAIPAASAISASSTRVRT